MIKINRAWAALVSALVLGVVQSVLAAPPDDDIPPTVPGNFAATAISGTQINLSWTASFDQHQITYYLDRCQGSCVSLGTTTGLSFSDAGLAPGTTYTYQIYAVDGWANIGGAAQTSATTPDTQAPTSPSGLVAAAVSGSQINLSWGAATDNVGVTGYQIERCQGSGCSGFAYLTTVGGLGYGDTGLANATTYTYRVRAIDAVGNPSTYSNAGAATTTDTQAPLVPGGMSASASGATQINVSWSASSDNVGVSAYVLERCQGIGCSSFSTLTSVGSTSYSNTGLTPGTWYSYRVRAVDAASNSSSVSAVASAMTVENTAPSIPIGLSTGGITGTQINLSWTASTDNVGVTGYLVDRCAGTACSNFSQIGTPTTNSFSNTGLSVATTYRFRVRSQDAAGNRSDYSSIVSAATIDTQAPSTPAGLAATPNSSTQVTLTWTASTDNVAVTGYQIDRCAGASCTNFVQVGTPTTASFVNTGLTALTTYRYRVRAVDARPNVSSNSAIVNVATPENVAPTVPGGVTATVISGTQINLAWTASTDNVGVQDYLVERCSAASCTSFTQVAIATATTYSNTGLTGATLYRYRIRARDAALNVSAYSTIVQGTTLEAQAPSTPASLAASVFSSTQINLTWTASTDNVGVTGYSVERCSGSACTGFAQVATPTTNSFSNTGLTVATIYRFRVRARDAAGNWSSYSTIASATTTAPSTPTVPANLRTNSVAATQIVLAWNPSIDDIGVTQYLVDRCTGSTCTNFVQVATPSGTTFTNTSGIAAGNTYRYRVRARDGSGNMSDYSSILNVTTPSDGTPPTAPTGLTVTAGPNQLVLSWTASTDNMGIISAYLVERCFGTPCTYTQIASVTTTTHTDTSVTTATSYSYRVRARDSAGNLSSYSTVSSAIPAQCD